MRNWTVQVTDALSINVRSPKKDPAKKLARAIRDLINIQSFRLEKSGVYGMTEGPDRERESLFMVIGERQQIPQPALYKKDLDQFLSSIPDPVFDPEKVMETAHGLLLRHVKVDDKRQTKEQLDDENEKMKEIDRHLAQGKKEKDDAFINQWCLPEKVDVPEGMMAICLQITYDDSDPMSDYSAPHRSYGLPMLLAVVPPQPKTERLARNAISGCTSLNGLKFEWRTENYSMGHGNYLISEWTGNKIPCRAYNGRTEADTRFEVVFNTRKTEYYPFREYQGKPVTGTHHASPAVMRVNEAKDGVELRYPAGVSPEAVAAMTKAGFRQNRFKTFWYAKRTEQTMTTARQLSLQAETVTLPHAGHLQKALCIKEDLKAEETPPVEAQPQTIADMPVLERAPAQQMLFA